MSPNFTSYLKRPIHAGDNTMLWPVLIIKLPVKGKVGSCLNISVWIQTKWKIFKYQGSNALKSSAKVFDYFSDLCSAWGSLPPWFNCCHCLSVWKWCNKEHILDLFHKTTFLNFSLPAWLFWVTLGYLCPLCVSGWTQPWHSAPPFLNLHLQAITKPLLLLTPEILRVQHLVPEMETADAVWHHKHRLKLNAGPTLPHWCTQLVHRDGVLG